MSGSQYHLNALLVLRKRLDVEHLTFDAVPEVRAALMSIRNYIHVWVLPVISVAEGHDPQLREWVNKDAAKIRKAIRDHIPHPELALCDTNRR